MTSPRTAIRVTHTAAIIAITATIAGCASQSTTTPRTRVTPSDFRTDSSAPPHTPAPVIHVAPAESSGETVEVIVLTGAPGAESAPRTLTLGASDLPTDPPSTAITAEPRNAPAQSGYLVDAFLGQVNGKPIYADEFLDPMDARLAAEAKRMDTAEWQRFAAREIARSLRDVLQDELLLAEFRASLSAEERVGIGAFVDRIRQGLISESGGSREVARTRLLDAEGLTLNEKVDDEVKRAFIREQIRREIADSVAVSFRDIEVYYDLHPEEFAPPPTAMFRIIRAPITDADKVARIERALQAGASFKELAEEETAFAPARGGTLELTLDTPDVADATIFGPEPLNEAARALSVGQVSPRVDFNDAAWWIKLEYLEREPGQTLYEAQFDIEQILKQQRYAEAERDYFRRIVGRAGLEDQEDVAIKLMEFAIRRHQTRG